MENKGNMKNERRAKGIYGKENRKRKVNKIDEEVKKIKILNYKRRNNKGRNLDRLK